MNFDIKEITNKLMNMKLSVLLLTVFLTAGCASVGPDYKQPEMDMPAQWHTVLDPALLPDKTLMVQWWTLFEDPILNSLIDAASQNNLDLLTAIARVEETRSHVGMVTGEHYPDVDVTGSVSRNRGSENSLGQGYKETLYSSGIGAGWEIDLFGRIRRNIEAAKAEYQASEEDRIDVMITVYAEVSRTYLDIRIAQARLAASLANIESQKETLRLIRSRLKHGLSTELDVARAERVLANAEAEIPPLRMILSQSINNLAVLLGRQPGSLYSELMTPGPIPLPPKNATVGVPADLLRHRPDIRRAERLLAAQTARIGVATAELYPSFTLTGSFGYESIDAGDLFDPASRVFSFGPSLRWNIFSGGRIRNQIKAQDAITRQALLAYEHAVLNALREVENILKAYVEDKIRLAALERSVEAARKSVKLATDLYTQGLSDFQPVLDAQRSQFTIENQLAVASGETAANFVRLYSALGGGWNPENPSPKAPGAERKAATVVE